VQLIPVLKDRKGGDSRHVCERTLYPEGLILVNYSWNEEDPITRKKFYPRKFSLNTRQTPGSTIKLSFENFSAYRWTMVLKNISSICIWYALKNITQPRTVTCMTKEITLWTTYEERWSLFSQKNCMTIAKNITLKIWKIDHLYYCIRTGFFLVTDNQNAAKSQVWLWSTRWPLIIRGAIGDIISDGCCKVTGFCVVWISGITHQFVCERARR